MPTKRPEIITTKRPIQVDHGLYWIRHDDDGLVDVDAKEFEPLTEEDLFALGWRGQCHLYDRFAKIMENLGFDHKDEQWNHLQWFVEYVYQHDLDWFLQVDSEIDDEIAWLNWVAKAPIIDESIDGDRMVGHAIDTAARSAAGSNWNPEAEKALKALLDALGETA